MSEIKFLLLFVELNVDTELSVGLTLGGCKIIWLISSSSDSWDELGDPFEGVGLSRVIGL